MALTYLLLLARTEAVLQEAVNEAVKTASTHMYPVDLLVQAYGSHPYLSELENKIETVLPPSLKMMIQAGKWGMTYEQHSKGNGRHWTDGEVHRIWASSFLQTFVDRNANGEPLLDPEKLIVRRVVFPDFQTEETSYFGFMAEYRLTLPIPWLNRELIITAAAMERCWVGKK